MSAISDFAALVNAKFTEMGQSLDAINVSLTGVTNDIAMLKALIEQLQNSQGEISAEDQALLDQIQASANTLGGNLDAVKNALAALDAQTENPPTP